MNKMVELSIFVPIFVNSVGLILNLNGRILYSSLHAGTRRFYLVIVYPSLYGYAFPLAFQAIRSE